MQKVNKPAILLIALCIFFISGCSNNSQGGASVEYEVVRFVVDEAVINTNDDFKVVEPVFWSVSIYDGEKQYEKDLEAFSLPQRYVFAIEWYMAEVNNGGHDQFYWNSTGIVWEDAMNGFQAIKAQINYEIIKESANMMGGNPSKNWDKRQNQLEKFEPDFSTLDDRFYESEAQMIELLLKYIKENAADFFFDGEVKIPK